MKTDHITEQSIQVLVDTFYERIRAHPTLGPVFIQAIGEGDDVWRPHLAKMYDFWSSVMLTSGRYHGTPVQKHKGLPPFDAELFDQWLVLFEDTARDIHSDEIAMKYVETSQRIANSLKLALYYKPEESVHEETA